MRKVTQTTVINKAGDEGEDVCLLLLREIDREGPQGEDRQRLIGPPEILPYRIETIGVLDLPDQQGERDGKDGHADIDAIDLLALTQTEGLGDDQAGRPKGRVSRRNRGCHHTECFPLNDCACFSSNTLDKFRIFHQVLPIIIYQQ